MSFTFRAFAICKTYWSVELWCFIEITSGHLCGFFSPLILFLFMPLVCRAWGAGLVPSDNSIDALFSRISILSVLQLRFSFFFLSHVRLFLVCETSVLLFCHGSNVPLVFCVFAGQRIFRRARSLRVGPLCVPSGGQECLHYGPQLRRAVFRWAGESFLFSALPVSLFRFLPRHGKIRRVLGSAITET